jgi:hypothetical protein
MIPAFSAWIESPGARHEHEQDGVRDRDDLRPRSGRSDRLEEDEILAGRVEDELPPAGRLGQPAEVAARAPSSG